MLVRFIAHAGIYIEENDTSLLIDPWFRGSSLDHPIIESIDTGGSPTIDFQVPPTEEKIDEYFPNMILLSHFHAHHSSARDVIELCNNSKEKGKRIRLHHPRPLEGMEESLKRFVPDFVLRKEILPDETVTVGPFTVKAIGHTSPLHNGWFVTSESGSVLHIADARLNKDNRVRVPDDTWQQLKGLSPTLLLTSTGGHSMRPLNRIVR